MSDQPRFIRVFLSSPGDVADERGIARKVIEEAAGQAPFRDQLMVKIIAWDNLSSRTPMLATLTPQEAINRRLPKPSECDIVVVLFWSRMGTQLPYPEYQKPNGDPYYSGTEWEYLDAICGAGENPHGLPLVIVYRRTEKKMLTIDDPEFDEKRQQYNRVEEFFNQFNRPSGEAVGGYNPYETPDKFRQLFEIDIRELLDTVLKMPTDNTPEQEAPVKLITQELWLGSPFPGLRAFTPDDAPIFFGRGRETDELIRKVNESRFIAVVGASGSGKSSLVAAGLLPRLKERAIEGSQDWILPHMQEEERREWTGLRFTPAEVGENPFVSLAVKLAPMVRRSPRKVAEELADDTERLGQLCQELLADQPDWAEVLVFIDQFEELFTLVMDEKLRRNFIAMLVEVAQARRVRIVVTLRADFYHRCVEYPALAQILRAGSFPLASPEVDALLEMITRPAERAGLEFEKGLPGRIIRDTGQEPGALALLAYMLDELYQDCCDSADGVLSQAEYEALGGVQGAIGERAESVFAKLDPAAQAMLPQVFRELVEVDERGTATRQRAPLRRFEKRDAAWMLLMQFTEARLLTTSASADEGVVEVAHEAIFRHWRRLAEWIETAQDDLRLLRQVRLAAKVWDENDRNPVFLWPDERLKPVYEMVERLQPELDEVIEAFIQPERERLWVEIEDIGTIHQRRSVIGERLAAIGDTRPGVGLRSDGLPDIVWCAVPGGEVELENRGDTFTVQPFYIAQYPSPTCSSRRSWRPQGVWERRLVDEIGPKIPRA